MKLYFYCVKTQKFFYGEDFDKFSKLHNNIVEICDCIGGFNGAIKFLQFMERFIEKNLKRMKNNC